MFSNQYIGLDAFKNHVIFSDFLLIQKNAVPPFILNHPVCLYYRATLCVARSL